LFALFGLNIVLVHLTAYSVTININKDMAAMLISVFGISLCIGQLSFGVIGKVRCGPVIIYSASYILSGLVVILMTVVQDFISLAILSAALGFSLNFVSSFMDSSMKVMSNASPPETIWAIALSAVGRCESPSTLPASIRASKGRLLSLYIEINSSRA
jgi:MFS family permease